MGFRDSLQSIFSNARKSASKQAYDNIDSGIKTKMSPESLRFSYENHEDSELNKDWKPQTKAEQKTLSPEGFHRIGERNQAKENLLSGIFESARAGLKAEDERRVQKAKEEGKKTRRTNAKKIDAQAEQQANKLFNEQYLEKQIAIPSTAIKDIDYDPKSENLEVKFQGGNKNYFYPHVPVEVIKAWLKSPSKGEYFMRNIHDQYTLNPGHRASANTKGRIKSYNDVKKINSGKDWSTRAKNLMKIFGKPRSK